MYVGGAGANNPFAGAWNGGGDGLATMEDGNGRPGGGATDFRLVSGSVRNDVASLRSRIMVAGGGGGASNYRGAGVGPTASG